MRNSLGQVETYQIDGPKATYLGAGDLHDPAYDHMGTSASIVDYLSERASPLTQSFTSADLTNEYVSYEITVYPSTTTEAEYVNDNPLYYALAIASVFLFTASIFIVYNCLVEHRQRVVMDRAVKSTAVVQSLFPENVAERLYEEQEKENQPSKANGATKNNLWKSNAVTKRPSVSEFITGEGSTELVHSMNPAGSAPIADCFPEATVFFADLAGFTKWSSERTPVEVFGLLESIYGAFDKCAAHRGVFKVETIGDCYVAVTGVPNAQKDHAVIMSKFAFDCSLHLQQLISGKLAEDFGEDTRELSLRVGLHSGAVTAGVLRGEKGRFQLFGDTVNTAARMESTGVPGRIQVSQATADLLVVAGKGEWIKAREGLVNAKGKGEMQTYWLHDSVRSGTNRSGKQSKSPRRHPRSVQSLRSATRSSSIGTSSTSSSSDENNNNNSNNKQ